MHTDMIRTTGDTERIVQALTLSIRHADPGEAPRPIFGFKRLGVRWEVDTPELPRIVALIDELDAVGRDSLNGRDNGDYSGQHLRAALIL